MHVAQSEGPTGPIARFTFSDSRPGYSLVVVHSCLRGGASQAWRAVPTHRVRSAPAVANGGRRPASWCCGRVCSSWSNSKSVNLADHADHADCIFALNSIQFYINRHRGFRQPSLYPTELRAELLRKNWTPAGRTPTSLAEEIDRLGLYLSVGAHSIKGQVHGHTRWTRRGYAHDASCSPWCFSRMWRTASEHGILPAPMSRH